jgi:hypothetical protein
VFPYQVIKARRNTNVPAFWKLIIQANFHGRGPPRKSQTRVSVERRKVPAHRGASYGVGLLLAVASSLTIVIPCVAHQISCPLLYVMCGLRACGDRKCDRHILEEQKEEDQGLLICFVR